MVENVSLARDHRLRKHAAALVGAGMRVTVICRRDPGNRTAVAGVRVLDYPPPRDARTRWGFVAEYGYSLVMAALLTLRVLATGGVDIVQVSSTPDIYFLVVAPLRWCGCRVVFDFKDLSPEILAARYGRRDGLMYSLLIRLERASLRAADHVVVVNGAVRDVAMQRGGVPADAVTVVGNGPRLSEVVQRPARAELRRGFRQLCCLVGMMGPQDGVDLAVEAVAHVVHTLGRRDCAFTFVGIGDAVDGLRERVAQRGLQEWVTFPGWAQTEEVGDYLCTADVGVEPNVEGFVSPVKAMEYMAFGLPFVAFDVAQTRLLAGESAALAPVGDVLAFAELIDGLLDDAEARATMGEAGRRAVRESLAWEHQEERYLTMIRQLAGVGSARTGASVHGSPA